MRNCVRECRLAVTPTGWAHWGSGDAAEALDRDMGRVGAVFHQWAALSGADLLMDRFDSISACATQSRCLASGGEG